MSHPDDEASSVQREIDSLRHDIERMNYAYYVLDQPIATDAEFDQALNRLRELEAEHPDLITPESPTQRVGTSPFDRHQHNRNDSRRPDDWQKPREK